MLFKVGDIIQIHEDREWIDNVERKKHHILTNDFFEVTHTGNGDYLLHHLKTGKIFYVNGYSERLFQKVSK